jgi:ABC-type uncharacterized transport system involved in gliding motility auxiliary subunit
VVNGGLSFVNMTLDTTTARVNSLSPNSTSLLSEVTEPVTITLYRSDPLPAELDILRTQFRDMIGKFGQYSSGNITLTEIITNTDERQKQATDAGIPAIQIQTLKNDQFATQK